MTFENEPVTDLVRMDASAEVVDPEALQETDRRISEIARIAQDVDASAQKAEEARRAAQLAKEKSAGLGRKRAAIETLQEAGVAASIALASLADSQAGLFDNQKKLAEYIRELTSYALGSVANMRLVYRHLQAKLSGASQGELNELARRELHGVMHEFKRQLDLAERQEQMDKKLLLLRNEVARQADRTDQAISEDRDEHDLFHQAASLTRSNAKRLDTVVEDLERQREVDREFNESMRTVIARLDEVRRTGANAASRLTTEGARGEQRDESIAQLYALAGSMQDANRQSSAAIADSVRSTTEIVRRLRGQLLLALCTAVAGVVLGAAALLLTLLR